MGYQLVESFYGQRTVDAVTAKGYVTFDNPRRQSIYGTTLALLTSQLFKQINMPGKRHSAVLIDELPTIYIRGLDNLIDTGRQNKVAVVLGGTG